MKTPRASALLLAAALVAGAAPAAGQDAISLFKQGRALVEQNRWAEACPLFQEAHRIDPNALGILLNLADCSKQIGNSATAWSSYQEAEFLAKKTGDAGREKYAHDNAAALEPTLSRIVIHARETPGLIIQRDDQMVGKGIWGTGTALPIDPGAHKIEATAPGYSVWSTTITVGPRSDLKTIEIPQLVPSETAGPGGGPSPRAPPSVGYAVGGLGGRGPDPRRRLRRPRHERLEQAQERLHRQRLHDAERSEQPLLGQHQGPDLHRRPRRRRRPPRHRRRPRHPRPPPPRRRRAPDGAAGPERRAPGGESRGGGEVLRAIGLSAPPMKCAATTLPWMMERLA